MNEMNNPINRKNITSNIMLHFVTNLRNNELDSKYLLKDNDIKMLNSLAIPRSNLVIIYHCLNFLITMNIMIIKIMIHLKIKTMIMKVIIL